MEYLFEFVSVFSSVTLSKGLERNPELLNFYFELIGVGASHNFLFLGLLLYSFDVDLSLVDC